MEDSSIGGSTEAKIAIINQRLNAHHATLIAVTKTRSEAQMEAVAQARVLDWGENRVQEIERKRLLYPDVRWHMIGHLQSNKVKFIAPYIHLIHSVDSLALLQAINKEAAKCGRVIGCLLQIYIAKEESKYGLDEAELAEILLPNNLAALPNIQICGLMGMATNTEDTTIVRKEFAGLKTLFDATKAGAFAESPTFNTLSMGMSGDWELALEEGSTMIRIGSLLF